jgi:hypothetical protein
MTLNPDLVDNATIISTQHAYTYFYSIGDITPEGGTVFYVNQRGFRCGATLSSTCKYLEVAPKGWSSFDDDPQLPFSKDEFIDTNIEAFNGFSPNLRNIGQGLANTNSIVNQNGSCDTPRNCTYAAGAAAAYDGGGYHDWYLPEPTSSTILAQAQSYKQINYSLLGIHTQYDSYWNSWSGNPQAPGAATDTTFSCATNGCSNNGYSGGYKGKNSKFYVRPIRAF